MAYTLIAGITPCLRNWAVCGALALAHAASALAQQPTKLTPEQVKHLQPLVIQALTGMAQDDARLELAVDNVYGLGLAPDKRALVKSNIRSLLVNERIPAYLLQSLAPVVTSTMSAADVQRHMARSIQELQQRGIVRLPTERMAESVRFTLGMTGAVPAATCKAMFLGKLGAADAVRLEQLYAASLPLDSFRTYTALQKDSAEAELAGYPEAKVPTAAQASSAQRANLAAMKERLKRLPNGVAERMASNPETTEPAAACLWFREITAAALDLAEPDKGWYLAQVLGGQ